MTGRTEKFKTVLHGVARRMGLDPETGLLSNQAATLTAYINDAVVQAYSYADWKDSVIIEEQVPNYDPLVTYSEGDVVWDADTEAYYEAQDATTGDALNDTNYWVETAAYTKTPVGRMLGVYAKDPREYLRAPRVAWEPKNGTILTASGGRYFLEFQEVPPVFESTEHSLSAAYAVGDVRYDPVTGECYQCITANTGEAITDTVFWSKVNLWFSIYRGVIYQALSEARAEEGDNSGAVLFETKATDSWFDHWQEQETKAGIAPRYGVLTRQAR